ncbi:tetratricopeptide repeat protein [Calothrix sp. NIES-2098]|uniref:tetratricopeptide repeat protein n=1 Tax=Calothrix sp. NIES-2098 TaxID=1954171 RepID=UPI000B60B711|nr:TPR repeat-containing protein [Calothrix sp. NIES-2098]
MKYLFVIWLLIFSLVFPGNALAQIQQPYTLISGLGTHHHPVSTQNPQAQKFFDQGLNLIYAFNHDEAARSFKYAAELDPQLAMAYWGIALALGPNINLDVDSDREQAAYAAIQQAVALSKHASQQEQDYINALAKRYSNNSHAYLYKLAVDYKNAMADLVKRYPQDLDAKTLYAESLMDLHPWQLWTKDGKPGEDTEEILAVLESVLKSEPNHPGANHYYIHAVEASLTPERALESAKRLETLVPAAGHLVHMPSHIYFRVGDYTGAMRSNALAIAQDEAYIQKNHVQGFYPLMYYSHNVHFLAVAAAMAGKYQEAIQAADKLVTNATPFASEVPMIEGYLGTKLLIQTRFSDWDNILKSTVPDDKLVTTKALWYFAHGMANAAKGNIEDAASDRAALLNAQNTIPANATIGMSPASSILDIASNLLDGKIAKAKQDYDSAIKLLETAVAKEDALNYMEPPDWYIPTREALGGVLLAKGDYAAAEKVFRADLQKYPLNGRSLFGLQASLQALGKDNDAKLVQAQFVKAWKNNGTQLLVENF